MHSLNTIIRQVRLKYMYTFIILLLSSLLNKRGIDTCSCHRHQTAYYIRRQRTSVVRCDKHK